MRELNQIESYEVFGGKELVLEWDNVNGASANGKHYEQPKCHQECHKQPITTCDSNGNNCVTTYQEWCHEVCR
jgi:hypothetical protein